MNTLLLSDDLMLGSQVTQAARRVGTGVQVVAKLDQLIDGCQTNEFQQVILDLNHPRADIAEIVARIRQAGFSARIVAIAPHVQTAKIEAAQKAGCEAVLTKGQFHASMPNWLSATD